MNIKFQGYLRIWKCYDLNKLYDFEILKIIKISSLETPFNNTKNDYMFVKNWEEIIKNRYLISIISLAVNIIYKICFYPFEIYEIFWWF